MLTWLGVCTIAVVLILILCRLTSVFVALTLVPIAAALAGGFGWQAGTLAMNGMLGVAPVAALLAFAVVYFGVMNDAGLFEPGVRAIVRLVGEDPVRICLGTAAIAAVAHLDGAGASTFMVTVPGMLPIFRRVGMSPLALTATTALSAGTMNMLPWGGPTTRAAAALKVGLADLFVPLIPAMVAGMTVVFICAAWIGRRERDSLVRPVMEPEAGAAVHDTPAHAAIGPRWWFNAVLTAATLAALVTERLPPAVTFVLASAIALAINFPAAGLQRERLTAHGHTAMLMVTTVLAAGVFMGIMTKSGMLGALASDLARALPAGLLRHLPVALGIASMPLSLVFDPDSFYYGLLPILAESAQASGGVAVEVGRAAVLGQMTTGFPVSPLTPSTFLLVGLAGVDLADHQRRTIPYAFVVTVVMTMVALATNAIGFR